MKYFKKILIMLVTLYVLSHLYDDLLEYRHSYTYEKVRKIEKFGKKLIDEGYAGRSCYRNKTNEVIGNKDCIKNLRMKSIIVEYENDPIIYYRGKSEIYKNEMCEMSLYVEDIGKNRGEIFCDQTWFKKSEADKIPIGRAVTYARKLKEERENKERGK